MSNDAIQHVDEISPTAKQMDEWVLEMEARLDNPDLSHPTKPLQTSIDRNREKWPSIFGNWQCWDDFGVSFLPETKKWEYVAYMKWWCGLNVRSFLEEIQHKEDLVWGYYDGVDERFCAENGKYFIEHLLVNSCFLIFAMVVLPRQMDLEKILVENKSSIEQFVNLKHFIFQDQMATQQYMLTIDYQIPWFVVEAVYTKHSHLSNLFHSPIHKLATLCFDDLYPGVHKSKVNDDTITLPRRGFKHLLHIFHWSRSPQEKFLRVSSPPRMMDNFYIPSAKDLQATSTVFEKHAGGSIDVDYFDRRLSSVMQLAPWHLLPYSIKIYESLLIFERHYGHCGFPFTTYVACMVCLLQTEEDVQLLRAIGIVDPNKRNDDKDVLLFVQEFKALLENDAVMSQDLYNLSEKVRAHLERVRAHHERKATARYYKEFLSRYCAISAIVGFLLFVFAFIQTIYSTLSYYKK